MRAMLFWLLGLPLPIVLVLYLLGYLSTSSRGRPMKDVCLDHMTTPSRRLKNTVTLLWTAFRKGKSYGNLEISGQKGSGIHL